MEGCVKQNLNPMFASCRVIWKFSHQCVKKLARWALFRSAVVVATLRDLAAFFAVFFGSSVAWGMRADSELRHCAHNDSINEPMRTAEIMPRPIARQTVIVGCVQEKNCLHRSIMNHRGRASSHIIEWKRETMVRAKAR